MNTEHDDLVLVTTVDTHQVGDVRPVMWWFTEYRPSDAEATWWQIGESEKECAYFFDEGEAWDYWNKLIGEFE